MSTFLPAWIYDFLSKNTGVFPITAKWRLVLLTLFAQVLCLDISCAAVISYEYDQFGQLSQAQYSDGTSQKYTYDSIGNRLQYKVLPNLLGDVDGDHALGLSDVIILLQIVSGHYQPGPLNINAGIHSSANIGLAEAIYVLQQLHSL